ncbi:hypothetical protein IWQ60_004147 [Tieghemiomyces parasiticus]|uniref:ARID domain-containing protein n=1 Tax=Tieghemiomyces parasiticus TaxID=78921 RepID=A0A9W8DVS6_9FUNG|nr:hypothetical protein IWQ60_004147 [Tieghemiomyces parasiticus]
MDNDLDPLGSSSLFGVDMNFDPSSLEGDVSNSFFDAGFSDSMLNMGEGNPSTAASNRGASSNDNPSGIDWPFGDPSFDENSLLDLSATEDGGADAGLGAQARSGSQAAPDSSVPASSAVPQNPSFIPRPPASQPAPPSAPPSVPPSAISLTSPNALPGNLPLNPATFQMLAASGRLTPQMQAQFMAQMAMNNRGFGGPAIGGVPGQFHPGLAYPGHPYMNHPGMPGANPAAMMAPPRPPGVPTTMSMGPPGHARSTTPQAQFAARPSPGSSPAGVRPATLTSPPADLTLSSPRLATPGKPGKSVPPASRKPDVDSQRGTPARSDLASPGSDARVSEEPSATPKKPTHNLMVAGKTTLKKMEIVQTGLRFPDEAIDPAMLRKLKDMSYPEFTSFLTDFLHDFVRKNPERRNVKEFKNPMLDNTEVDLQKLFWFVIGCGGFLKVAKNKMWKAIGLEMRVSQNNPAAPLLRRWYDDFLLPIEEAYVFPRNEEGIAALEASYVSKSKKNKAAAAATGPGSAKRKAGHLDPMMSPSLSSPGETPEPAPRGPTPGTAGRPLGTHPHHHHVNPAVMMGAPVAATPPTPTSKRPHHASVAVAAPAAPPSWQPQEYQTTPTGGQDLRTIMTLAQLRQAVPNVLHGGTVRLPDLVLSLQSGLDAEVARALNTLVMLTYYQPHQFVLATSPDLVLALIECSVPLLDHIRAEVTADPAKGVTGPVPQESPPSPVSESESTGGTGPAPPSMDRHRFARENYSCQLASACEYSLGFATVWQNLTAVDTNAAYLAHHGEFRACLSRLLAFHTVDPAAPRPPHWLYLVEYRKVLLTILGNLAPALALTDGPLAVGVTTLVTDFARGLGSALHGPPGTNPDRHAWAALDVFCKLTTADANRACLAQLPVATANAMVDAVADGLMAWPAVPSPSGTATDAKSVRDTYLLLLVLALCNLAALADPAGFGPEALQAAAGFSASTTAAAGTKAGDAAALHSRILHHPTLVAKLLLIVTGIQRASAPSPLSLVPRETLAQVDRLQARPDSIQLSANASGPGNDELPNLTVPRPSTEFYAQSRALAGGAGGAHAVSVVASGVDYTTVEGIVCVRTLEVLATVFKRDPAYTARFLSDLMVLMQISSNSPVYTHFLNQLINMASQSRDGNGLPMLAS